MADLFEKIIEIPSIVDQPLPEGSVFQKDVSLKPYQTVGVIRGTTVADYTALSKGTFGGDGTDGKLDTNDATVNINLANEIYVVKQYTSINIVTNNLTFTNPNSAGSVIVLKSQGDVTISATIDASGMGAAKETNGNEILDTSTHYGGTGTAGGGTEASAAAGGTGGLILSQKEFYAKIADRLYKKGLYLACGSGGGDGGDSVGGGAGGDGGAGGGVLYIECGGKWNFTSSNGISVAGKDGLAGTNSADGGGGGGGGGSAGMILILYNELTANTGTLNLAGGAGGKGGDGLSSGTNSRGSGGGAGGGSYTAAGGNGGNGGFYTGASHTVATTGSNGGGSGAGAGGGGGEWCGDFAAHTGANGGTGGSSDNVLVASNREFA